MRTLFTTPAHLQLTVSGCVQLLGEVRRCTDNRAPHDTRHYKYTAKLPTYILFDSLHGVSCRYLVGAACALFCLGSSSLKLCRVFFGGECPRYESEISRRWSASSALQFGPRVNRARISGTSVRLRHRFRKGRALGRLDGTGQFTLSANFFGCCASLD